MIDRRAPLLHGVRDQADAPVARQDSWYAVATQPRRELFAIAHLDRQGYNTFVPKRRVERRHARRTSQRIESFFPGYVFVRLDIAREQWRSINGTRGVRGLVMQGERPLPAPNGLVEQLLDMTDRDGFFAAAEAFRKGDRVRLLSGPFRESLAEVDRLASGDRVRVLLDIMQGRIPVVIERSELARAV